MSDVTRYAMVTDITPLSNGEWVRYEDYAALAAEMERVQSERDAANQRCEWVAAALRDDALYGPGTADPLVPPPAPERRTITREEFDAAADSLQNDYPLTYKEMTPYELAAHFSAAWGLTVEDA